MWITYAHLFALLCVLLIGCLGFGGEWKPINSDMAFDMINSDINSDMASSKEIIVLRKVRVGVILWLNKEEE